MKSTGLWRLTSPPFFLGLLSALALVAAAGRGADGQQPSDVAPALAKLRAIDVRGKGHVEAMTAWKQLASAPTRQIPEILAGMKGANPLAMNWFRAAAEAIADREIAAGGKLPVAALAEFLQDTNQEPKARRLAYELILRVDSQAPQRFLAGRLNDPSLEIRRDAVAMALSKAQDLAKAKNIEQAVAAYQSALSGARDIDQINEAADQLKKLNRSVDLPTHFGFVMRWQLIGPFDNRNTSGFDVAYPPEKEIDLAASYDGQLGKVKWIGHTSQDTYGEVDLNKALGNHKGAIAYALSEFYANREAGVELRLGCINANKIWLNGKLLTSNHVYHANTFIDQYTGKGRLKKGKNVILLKIAQNEQTEAWAQRWQFQLRVCDQYGTAILSQDRPISQTASLRQPLFR